MSLGQCGTLPSRELSLTSREEEQSRDDGQLVLTLESWDGIWDGIYPIDGLRHVSF